MSNRNAPEMKTETETVEIELSAADWSRVLVALDAEGSQLEAKARKMEPGSARESWLNEARETFAVLDAIKDQKRAHDEAKAARAEIEAERRLEERHARYVDRNGWF